MIDVNIKRNICSRINSPQDKKKKYHTKDVKTGFPEGNCGCYVIVMIDNYPHIFYGKFENGKFYKAIISEGSSMCQHIYYHEITADAYVKYIETL